MGCGASSNAALAKEQTTNREINKSMRKAENVRQGVVELLILGTGDSGKTTLRKQLANVHNTTFQNETFRRTFATAVMTNLIDGVLEVLAALDKKDDMYESLEEFTRQSPSFLDAVLAEKLIKIIHDDPAFMKIALGRDENKVQIQDCWFVFVEELKSYPAWGGPEWIPSVDDCVRARIRTSGVIKEEIMIDSLQFLIYDVGGQRAERRKWLHMFDSVMSCIFVAALSEYDQVLFEDRSKNRLEEALELFAETINSSWLSKATAMLFLNKKDIFHKKYSEDRVPLNISGRFPQAPAGNDDEEAAIEWISQEFTSRKRGNKVNNKIYVHRTTATDARNIKAVFQITKDVILNRSMLAAGFIK